MAPFSILVVCVGNVCRSPLAERLLRLRLDEQHCPPSLIDVRSAGVRALRGASMHPRMQDALDAAGGSADGFEARQLTNPMISEAGVILTATGAERTRVLEEVPGALRRTFTILDFATLVAAAPAGLSPTELVAHASQNRSSTRSTAHDVPDPIGGPPEVFAEVSATLDSATRTIAAALATAVPRRD